MNEVQERILLKADEQFRTFGIRSVTMDEIAHQSGISKKTIYLYFKDKNELVDAVMMTHFNDNHNKCKACSVNAENAIDEIFMLMKNIGEDFRTINPIILLDMKKFHNKTFEKFQKHLDETITQMVLQNLVRGIKEGLFRKDIDKEIIARFRMASIWILFDQNIFPYPKFDLSKVFTEILRLFLFGLVTPKGYELIEKYQIINTKK
jgi:TetR/AcrR family transcriptional regulator, cholesterol catabolism regulator